MQISIQPQVNIYNSSSNNHLVNFSANPKSPKLKFSKNDFFVNIKGYGKNNDWASVIQKTADKAAALMALNKSSDEVLKEITRGVKNANGFCKDEQIRRHTGILRTKRKGYGKTGSWKNIELVTPVQNKYIAYEAKLRDTAIHPVKSPFKDISTAKIETIDRIDYDMRIVHPSGDYVNNALDRVKSEYSNLKKNFISHPDNITDKSLPEINSAIAEIRWILAHSMPWERGSDSISNVFTRSLYKSMGIKSYPLKKGISLDLEAFCTPLNEYKKNFAKYFEEKPQIVE